MTRQLCNYADNDTNIISWNINGYGPLTYTNLKFNIDVISDKTEQDNSQEKYKSVKQNQMKRNQIKADEYKP